MRVASVFTQVLRLAKFAARPRKANAALARRNGNSPGHGALAGEMVTWYRPAAPSCRGPLKSQYGLAWKPRRPAASRKAIAARVGRGSGRTSRGPPVPWYFDGPPLKFSDRRKYGNTSS